jgi:hypothetical protein
MECHQPMKAAAMSQDPISAKIPAHGLVDIGAEVIARQTQAWQSGTGLHPFTVPSEPEMLLARPLSKAEQAHARLSSLDRGPTSGVGHSRA